MSRPTLTFKAIGLSRRWAIAIGAAKQVVAFSPYITASPVTRALQTKGSSCCLYTVVSVENYASGGSEISCLQKLFDSGVRVFHLERLHAKILLVPDEYLTVGSQNMTAGGLKNLEANVVFGGSADAEAARLQVQQWMSFGKLLTESALKALESSVAKLKTRFRQLKHEASVETNDIWAKWQHEEDRRRRASEDAAKKPRWRGFQERIASQVIRGKIVKLNGEWSLRKADQDPAVSYCHWSVQWRKNSHDIRVGEWHPCFHLDTKQWGKARAYQGVISFIAQEMGEAKRFSVGGDEYHIAIECNVSQRFNIEFDVSRVNDIPGVKILGRYLLTSISADEIRADPVFAQWLRTDISCFHLLVDAINSNENGLQAELLKIVLDPWGKGSPLGGEKRVDRFFQTGATVYTGLRLIGGNPVLVFSQDQFAITHPSRGI